MIKPDDLPSMAADKMKENKKFFMKLKKLNPRDLDLKFAEFHEEVFGEIDCLDCGNCCKTIPPMISDRDIQRIASHLGIKPSVFTTDYLRMDEDGDYIFRQTPCPFLGPDNYCAIYAVRQKSCREYPHTDRKKMIQLLTLTHKNTYVCPAVFEIVEALKGEY